MNRLWRYVGGLRPSLGGVSPPRRLLLIFGILASIWMLGLGLIRGGDRPPLPGDAMDYEAVAYSLHQGWGYGYNWGDPGFRSAYESRLAQGDRISAGYAYMLNLEPRYTDQRLIDPGEPKPDYFSRSAFRPPGMPMALAAVYEVVGRQFWVWRALVALSVAGAGTLVFALGYRLAGPWVAWLAGGLFLVDPAVLHFLPSFMTEAPVLVMVTVLLWLIELTWERRKARYAWASAVVLGLMVLLRTQFVLWIPGVMGVLGLVWACRLTDETRSWLARLRIGALGATGLLMVAMLIPAPWWARNTSVLGGSMPLGTQGGIGLPGGYSDTAWDGDGNPHHRRGIWIDVEHTGVYEPARVAVHEAHARAQETGEAVPSILMEKEKARAGMHAGLQWIQENPGKSVALVGYRLWRSWMGGHVPHALPLLALGLAGLGYARRRHGVWGLWTLPLLASLALSATYSADGRFLVPVLPSLHLLGAIGLVALWERWRHHREHAPRTANSADPSGQEPI